MTRSIRPVLVLALTIFAGCSGDGHSHENNDHHSNGHADDIGHGHEGDVDEHHHGPAFDTGNPDLGTPDLGADVTITPAAYDYCECMLLNCHTPFHDRWGVDDADATNACAAEASTWPVAGAPATSGDSFECRQHHCSEVAAGNSTCDNALGAACQ